MWVLWGDIFCFMCTVDKKEIYDEIIPWWQIPCLNMYQACKSDLQGNVENEKGYRQVSYFRRVRLRENVCVNHFCFPTLNSFCIPFSCILLLYSQTIVKKSIREQCRMPVQYATPLGKTSATLLFSANGR